MAAEVGSARQRIRAADWWALALIVGCYAFYNLDKSLVPVLIEPIKAEFRLSDAQMGLLTGLATSVPFALACIPVGILADRVNRRNLLAMLVAGWSLATALTSIATSVVGLFLSRIGIGTFEAGFTPAALSSLSDRFPARMRATVMGLFNIGATAGLFGGMAMGGFVEDNYGWRAAFLIAGVPGLVLALLLYLTTVEPPRGQFDGAQVAEKREPLRTVLLHLLDDKAQRHIAIGMTWGASMLAVFAVWTPSLMRRSFELSATDAGVQSAFIVGFGGMLGASLGGIVADRIGGESLARRMWVPMGGVALSALVGLVALLGGLGAMPTAVLLGCATFFGQGYIGTSYALAATLAGPARRAVTLSLLLVSFNLISYSLGSGLIGKLSDVLTPEYGPQALRYAYAAGFVFFMLSLLHFRLAYRELARRELVGAANATV